MTKKYECPCCGQKTLDSRGEFGICSVCMWEDDSWDAEHPDEPSSCNRWSLNESRRLYKKYKKNLIQIYNEKKGP